MRSDIPAAALSALSKNVVHMALLAQLDFETGTEYLWAGPEGQSLDYDGQTWVSLADLGQIDKIAEAEDLRDSRSTVTLRVNSETVSTIGVDDSRGNAATLRLLILDEEGNALDRLLKLGREGACLGFWRRCCRCRCRCRRGCCWCLLNGRWWGHGFRRGGRS